MDIKTILGDLTLEEKASLLSGSDSWHTKPVDRLGVPSVMMADGPHGLRKEQDKGGAVNIMRESHKSTCFPPAVTVASSWDRNLVGEIGVALGEEAKDQGVTTVLGPGTNIKRSPLCGRNFEYFSEDPFLSAEMATNYVLGVQSTGVGTSLKHFCGNNQEHRRMSIDARIDERAMREIYLPAFEYTVKRAQPSQIMCSYNRLNGTYLSDNKRMLTDVLRNEWGFKGLVVSDWGAVNDRIKGVQAGMDLEMPGNNGLNDREVVAAVRDGKLTEAEVDACAERVLEYVERSEKSLDENYHCDYDAHHQLARKAAESGAVLLKNEENILPLRKGERVTIIGKLAECSRYQGAGSSRINPIKLVSILDALRAEKIDFEYAEGYNFVDDGYSTKLLNKAVNLAKGKDKVVVVIGLTDVYESEGFDRTHMDLPVSHNKLVSELLKVNENVIVLYVGGSPATFPWHSEVKALLNLYLGGQAGGEAACRLLFGDVSPCGKLAETFPKHLQDNVNNEFFPMGPKIVEYRESIFVGYRYFDAAKKDVRFPFGFGLSYTDFEYSDISVSKKSITETELNDEGLKVSFKIKNVGRRKGAEIAQVYVKDKVSTVFMPEKALFGFDKVYLDPEEEKTVEITLNARAFSFYDTDDNHWSIEQGDFEIMVGKSSRDIVLSTTVTVSPDTEVRIPDFRISCPVYYNLVGADTIQQEEFEVLCGVQMPDNKPCEPGAYHINSTVEDVSETKLGTRFLKLVSFVANFIAKDSSNKLMILNGVKSMPIRALNGFTGGFVSKMATEGLLEVLNKQKGGWKKFREGLKKENRMK